MNSLNRYLFPVALGVALLPATLGAQTVIAGGGNYVSGGSFYLGTHSGSPSGFVLSYDDVAADGVKLHANRIASWLWENFDGTTTWPSMRLDQSNNLILYNGVNEAVKLDPLNLKLTLGGSSGASLTASGTGLTTSGALTVGGGFTNSSGSITGGASGLSLSAGGTNQNISLTSSGSGYIYLNGKVGVKMVPVFDLDVNGQINSGFVSAANKAFLAYYPAADEAIVGNTPSNWNSTIRIGPTTHTFYVGGANRMTLGDGLNSASMHVFGPSLGGTVGNTSALLTLQDANSNGNFLKFLQYRNANGSNWATATTRIQQTTDSTNQGYIDFNPPNGNHGLAIGSLGTEYLRIQNGGNVGIGTTSPTALLQVGQGPYSNQALKVGVAGNMANANAEIRSGLAVLGSDATTYSESGAVAWNFYNAGNSPSWAGTLLRFYGSGYSGNVNGLPAASQGTLIFQNTSNGVIASNGAPIHISPVGVPAASFTSSGYVGIGTTTPTSQLEISNSVTTGNSPLLKLTNTSGATPGAFGPGVVLNNSVAGKHGYILQQRQDANSYFSIANTSSPYTEFLVVDQTGNVGVGTTSPGAALDIGGTATANGALRTVLGRLGEGNTTGSGTFLGVRAWATQPINAKMFSIEDTFYGNLNSSIEFYRGSGATGGFMTFTTGDGSERLRIDGLGNVGIGTTSPSHKLAVKGTIRAYEVIVDNTWADYVFDDDYRLAPLSEVEQHIKAERHLPGIPSAAEVAAHGVSMGDMQAKLLSKVEELTLHLIRMEKENAALRDRVHALETASATR